MLKSKEFVEILLESTVVLDDDKERLFGHLDLQTKASSVSWWQCAMRYGSFLVIPSLTIVSLQKTWVSSNVAISVAGVSLTVITGYQWILYDRSARRLREICHSFEILESKTKTFLSSLREREIALYSIGHSKSAVFCCKTARINFLKYYRDSIETLLTFSRRIKDYMNYPVESLEFLMDTQPKLLKLVKHRPIVDDDALSIDGLRNIFHFFLLVRSEMLHFLAIDLIYRNSYSRNRQMVVELCDVTVALFGKATDFLEALVSSDENQIKTKARKLQNLARLEYSVNTPSKNRRLGLLAVLEDLIFRLDDSTELPADCNWLSEGLKSAMAIVKEHQQDELEKSRRLNVDKESVNPMTLLEVMDDEECDTGDQIIHDSKTEPTLLQVFEGMCTDKKKSDAFDDAETACITDEVGRSPYMGMLMDELRTVMKPRTELAFVREREAIARARNVAVEEVPVEDVFPDLKTGASTSTNAANSDAWLDRPFTYYDGRSDHTSAMTATVIKLADLINARQANDTADIFGEDSD